MITGRYDDAIQLAEKLLDLHPQMRAALEMKGWCIGAKGDWEKAVGIFEEVYRLTNHPLKGLTPLAFAYGQLGEKEKALECIRKIEQRQQEDPDAVMDVDLAVIWWSLGDIEKTFYHLFQCVEKRLGPVALITEYPMFEGLSDDPRYALLRKKLGL